MGFEKYMNTQRFEKFNMLTIMDIAITGVCFPMSMCIYVYFL